MRFIKSITVAMVVVVGSVACRPAPLHHWSEAPVEVQAEHSPEVIQGWIDAFWVNQWVNAYNANRWYAAAAVNARLEAERAEAARQASSDTVWDRLAQCESGGNWSINTGNGYFGGIQFSLRSWRGVGGVGYPHQASREYQIEMGERLRAQGGWGHWPACSRRLGLR